LRVAVVDRHPAMRAGIEAILERTRGVEVVAAAGGNAEALVRMAPDVVMIEDAPGSANGVALAGELKALGPAPKVLLHADRPGAVHVATAMLADADGVLDITAHPREMVEAVRTVAAGGTAFPELGARELRALAQRLPPEDHAILAMRLAATPRREISDTLRIDGRALRRRVAAMIARLRAPRLSSA
jgi:two-component system response regulator DesR